MASMAWASSQKASISCVPRSRNISPHSRSRRLTDMPRFIDLTHSLRNGLANFPGDPRLVITPHAEIPREPCNLAQLTMSTHQGTHLDAPRHFFALGRPVDEVPLQQFFGPASLIDLAPD